MRWPERCRELETRRLPRRHGPPKEPHIIAACAQRIARAGAASGRAGVLGVQRLTGASLGVGGTENFAVFPAPLGERRLRCGASTTALAIGDFLVSIGRDWQDVEQRTPTAPKARQQTSRSGGSPPAHGSKPASTDRPYCIIGSKVQPRSAIFAIVASRSSSSARPHSRLPALIMALTVGDRRKSRKLSLASFSPARLSDG
jgi:hypothetical protein